MKTGAKVALQVATIPTMFVPNIIGNKQKCDENIYPSDVSLVPKLSMS